MNHHTNTNATVIDPVCGMNIDPATAAGSSRYEGETYFFCSRGCATKFDAAPARDSGAAVATTATASCCSAGDSCC
ncbi:MAG TPA: YHS domain-containing protein [Thermoanaerobaculia bacterium]